MSDETHDAVKPVRIAYTGTRTPDTDDPRFELVHIPMLESESVDFDLPIIAELLKEDVQVVFFSSKAVSAIADTELKQHFKSQRLETWTVGSKTAQRVADELDHEARVPEQQDFDGLFRALDALDSRKIVVFGLEDAPRHLGEALAERVVHEFPVYRTFPRLYPDLGHILREFQPEWIAFTSPRGLDAFASQADQFDFPWRSLRMAAIGPTTGDALRDAHLEPDVELSEPGRDRLVDAMVEAS